MFRKAPFIRLSTGQLDLTAPVTTAPWSLVKQRLPSRWLDSGKNARTEDFNDDFTSSSLDANKWIFDHSDISTGFGNSGTFSLTDNTGLLRLETGTTSGFDNDSRVISAEWLDIRDSSVVVNMQPAPIPTTVGASFECGFRLYYGHRDPQNPTYHRNYIGWYLNRSQGSADFFEAEFKGAGGGIFLSGNVVPYNATNHRWLRIRESDSTLFFDVAGVTASDPPIESDFTNLYSTPSTNADPEGTLSAVTLALFFRLTGSVGSLTEAYTDFDCVNTATSSAVTATANLTTVLGTGQIGSTAVTDQVTLTTVLGTGQINTTTVTDRVALTNVLGTGQVGSTTATDQVALTTALGTGQVNTASVNDLVPLANVSATGQVNAPTVKDQVGLTNVLGTGQVNSPSVFISVDLTTVLGTGQAGNIVPIVPITTVSSSGLAGNLSVFIDVPLTNVLGSGQAGTIVPIIPITTVASSGLVGSLTASITAPLANVLSTGAVGSVAPTITLGVTFVIGTGAGSPFANVTVQPALTTVAATSAVNQPTVFADVGITTVLTTGEVGNVGLNPPVPLFTVFSPADVGSVSVAVDTSVTGAEVTGQPGALLANPPESPGKSHTDLYIRQLLEEYYTREWQKKEPKKPENAEPVPLRVSKPKANLSRRAVEQDPYLLLEPAVMRLAANTYDLKASLASLQLNFTVQSQPSESDEDEDLLLLSSVL